jgi:hypothetical protein
MLVSACMADMCCGKNVGFSIVVMCYGIKTMVSAWIACVVVKDVGLCMDGNWNVKWSTWWLLHGWNVFWSKRVFSDGWYV